MDSKNKYKLNEKQAQEELSRFSATETPGNLADEIGLVRVLIQSEIREGRTATIKPLADTLSALCKAHRIELTRAGELVSKQTARNALKAAGEAIAIVLEESGIVGWENLCDQIGERMLSILNNARNDQVEETA